MRIHRPGLGLACLVLASLATPASAATFFSTNFDSYVVDAGSPSGGAGWGILSAIEGWTASGPGIEVQNGVAGAAFSGANLVELDSTGNSSMSRLIDAGTYRLSYWYSARPGVDFASNGIALLIGGAQVSNVTTSGGAGTSWILQEYDFTVGAPTVLAFAATGASDSLGGYLDSITLSPVPEPGVWATLISGFAVLGTAMRRARRGQRPLPQAV